MMWICFANCDYCMPIRTDSYECFTSVHMKLNLYYFAAIVHVFILRKGSASAMYANNDIDRFEILH